MKNRKTNSKKGILLPETLKLIVAVLCIVLLIYLAVSLYGLFFKKTAIEQAKESLNQMILNIGKIEQLKETQNVFLLESPAKWYLVTFPYKDGTETPTQCGKYCVCICPSGDKGTALKDCSTMGACKDVSMKIETFNDVPIYIQGPSQLSINSQGDKIVISKI